MSAEAAEALVKSEYQMNPEKAVGPRKLREYLAHREGGPQEISVAELQAIRNGPPDSRPQPPRHLPTQVGKAPRDTITLKQARLRFQAKEQLTRADGKEKPTAADLEKRLTAQAAPGATWFTMAQVRNAEKFEFLAPTNAKQRAELAAETATFNANDSAAGKVLDADEARAQGIRSPRIRRSWRDVLIDEDPSQPDRDGKKIGDLEGALFSYTRDGNADSDTWNAHGALILPITFTRHVGSGFALRRFAFAPSVTYDRVSTNGDPAVEVDSLFYRAGLFLDFFGVPRDNFSPLQEETGGANATTSPALGFGLQVRASGVYVTDQNHRAGLTGFEADFEPRLQFGKLGLGYRVNLWPKKPARADFKDDTFLETQLRVWLHMEGGDLQDAAPGWAPATDSFFRLGPTAQFTLAAPALPGQRTLSLTAFYSYLAAISGPSDHPWFFHAALAYDLFRDPELNHKVGIAASYDRGGLNFTKQEVDTFTLGLSVLF